MLFSGIMPVALIIDPWQPRRFPLLTKEGPGEVAADAPNARRVDWNKHCFMNYRGSETQRRYREKRKSREKYSLRLCASVVKTHRPIIPSSIAATTPSNSPLNKGEDFSD